MATIALVGAGEYLERCRAVDEHLLGLLELGDRQPRVVCLPTASSTEGSRVWREWGRRGVEWFSGLGAEAASVDVVDRDSADDPGLAGEIEAADLVYLSGGKPVHLRETLAGTATWSAIEKVLAGGGILAGCSAGAMIQGELIAPLRSGGTPVPGFGLLDGAIVIPHFDEFPHVFRAAVEPLLAHGRTVIGVDGGTALVRHRGAFRVVGEGTVSVFEPGGGSVTLRQGETTALRGPARREPDRPHDM